MGKITFSTFQIELENKELLEFLKTLSDKKMAPFVKRAINRAGDKYVRILKREAAERYKVGRQSFFDQFIKKRKATDSKLQYKLEIRSSRLNMIRFAQLGNRRIHSKSGEKVVKKQKIAKSIEIIKGRKIELQTRGDKTWFVGNQGRTLFFRPDGEKKRIKAVKTISPTQMLWRKEFIKKAQKEAEEVYEKELKRSFDYYLSKVK